MVIHDILVVCVAALVAGDGERLDVKMTVSLSLCLSDFSSGTAVKALEEF